MKSLEKIGKWFPQQYYQHISHVHIKKMTEFLLDSLGCERICTLGYRNRGMVLCC
jgi:DNA-directed RNA polymerase subunit N (RpoN/RPB10)